MDPKKNKSILNSFAEETKKITQKILGETSKTYQSFKINMDIVNLKKRRRERCADLGFKVFNLIKDGKIEIKGVDYLVAELKALDFQVKLKEEDLVEMAAIEPKDKDEKKPEKALEPDKTKEEPKPKKAATTPAPKEKKIEKPKAAPKKATPKKKAAPKAKPKGMKELTAIQGIGDKLAAKFIKAGFDSVKKLADAKPVEIAKIMNRTPVSAKKLIDLAKGKTK